MTSNGAKELFGPLSLAAYAAWGAVWLTIGEFQPDDAQSWLSRVAMLVFLIAFMAEHLAAGRFGMRWFVALGAVMAVAALGVIGMNAGGGAPILLVLLACMLAARLDAWQLWLALLVVNAPFALILLSAGLSGRRLLISIVAYVSFQAFAALLMIYAKRAEAMSGQLREVNAELLATRSLLASRTRDQERLHLSRELHDVAGHSLTALKLNLAALVRDPQQPDPDRVALCAGLADDLLQNLRGVVAQMRCVEGVDLQGAIERLAAPFPRPALHLEIAADAQLDDIECAEVILRTVQEALTNAARHSNAGNLWVVLQRDGNRLRLELHDDGRGTARSTPGSGLSGLRERLQAVGGGLDIEHAQGQGLRLRAWLPAGHAA